jgi:hypothetical protein
MKYRNYFWKEQIINIDQSGLDIQQGGTYDIIIETMVKGLYAEMFSVNHTMLLCGTKINYTGMYILLQFTIGIHNNHN